MGIGRHMSQTEEGRKAGLNPAPYYRPNRVDPRVLQRIKEDSASVVQSSGAEFVKVPADKASKSQSAQA